MGLNVQLAYAGSMPDAAPTTTPLLSDSQLADWHALVAMVSMLSEAFDTQLKRDAGMNMFEYRVLSTLAQSPGHAIAMTDLAIACQGSPSRLSHAVGRLESAGWVERGSCVTAGRRTSAHLTDAGLAQVAAVTPEHLLEVRRRVVEPLSEDDLGSLGRAARAIVRGIEPACEAHLDGSAP